MVTTQDTKTSAFPVDWNESIEPGVTFMFDPMHFPYPVSPLLESTMGPAFATGFTAAMNEQNSPISKVEVCHRNHYRFERYVMKQPTIDDEARQIGEAAEESGKRETGRLMERWHDEHLPNITSRLNRLRNLDVEGASPDELVKMLDEVGVIHTDFWTIHFRVAIPMLMSMQLFDEFYAEVFEGTESDAHALVVGALSESIKAGIGLSDLAARARELRLDAVFRDSTTDSLPSKLEATEQGRQFLALLDAYLADYGLRQDLFEYTTPTWQEDPRVALASVRNNLRTGRDARAEHEAKARSAEDASARAREHLTTYPEAVRGQFEAMLQFGRNGAFLQEEHHFYIDQQGVALLRLFYLKVGQRLAEVGVIDNADDVFMLHNDEIRAFVADPDAGKLADNVRATIATRRDELQHARTMAPPPFIGDPPAGPPPGGNPMERALGRFFGGPPQRSDVPGQLKGSAGSKGIATGIARIARTLDDASHVEPGEILVAVTTMPAWTPLFGVASAVVTETGGALSHCAIVAREYGIPAVVGVHGATTAIKPGQRITVDGTSGIVTLDS